MGKARDNAILYSKSMGQNIYVMLLFHENRKKLGVNLIWNYIDSYLEIITIIIFQAN